MGGSSGGTQTVKQQQTMELPQWVTDAAQKNLSRSYDVAENLLPAYTGQRVAGMTEGQNIINSMLSQNIGSTQPHFANAENITYGVGAFQPGQVTPGFLSGTDLNPYMNPYTQNVIDKTMPLIEQQRQLAQNQNADAAIRSGAFAGSRHGITEGVTNAQTALQAGQLGAELNQQNFAQAQAAAQNDLARSLAAQQSNQAAGLQGAGLRLQAGQQLGNLAAQGQDALLRSLAAASAGQNQYQQQQQAYLDAARQAYGEQQQFPIQQLQIPASILGATPYGYTQSGTETGPGPTSSGLMQGLGAAGTAAGIAGSLLPLFGISDRNLKTDVKKVGKDEETGLPLYSYRYKGDSKATPKVVGPMAQDVLKKFPDQVRDIGGTLAVNLGFGPMRRAFQ